MTDTVTIEVGPAPTHSHPSKLFLLESLEDAEATRGLPESDLKALRSVADWIRVFVIQPHRELGRSGPVCPFTPVALESHALWLAAERSEGRNTPDLIGVINGYQRRLFESEPVEGDAANLKSIFIVFPDLPAARAKDFFAGALDQIAVPSYVEDGLVMGPFYEGNEGTAIYNPDFRPFQSPVPSFLMRRAVVSDWKFFLENEVWLKLWARRYGEAAVDALASELRRFPWRARRD